MATVALMIVNDTYCFYKIIFPPSKTFQDKLFVAPKLPTILPVPGRPREESVFLNSSFV